MRTVILSIFKSTEEANCLGLSSPTLPCSPWPKSCTGLGGLLRRNTALLAGCCAAAAALNVPRTAAGTPTRRGLHIRSSQFIMSTPADPTWTLLFRLGRLNMTVFSAVTYAAGATLGLQAITAAAGGREAESVVASFSPWVFVMGYLFTLACQLGAHYLGEFYDYDSDRRYVIYP